MHYILHNKLSVLCITGARKFKNPDFWEGYSARGGVDARAFFFFWISN